MRNDLSSQRDPSLARRLSLSGDGGMDTGSGSGDGSGASQVPGRPGSTQAVTRGAARLFTDLGFALVPELTLPNGRRADLAGLSRKGELVIVEVKSCREDFAADAKWPAYLEFCDRFYFATDSGFPADILPREAGRIVADAYGGAILAEAPARPMAGARRKAMTLRFARQAAFRLTL